MSKLKTYCSVAIAIGSILVLQPVVEAQNLDNRTPPFRIAQVLGCPRAEVLESYETKNFYVYICQGQQGYVFYRGVDKSTGNQINLEAIAGRNSTYSAVNGEYTYIISPLRLRVIKNGEVILSERVFR